VKSNLIRRIFQYGPRRNREHCLFWFRGQGNRNFGDLVGPYLHEKLLGRPPTFGRPDAAEERTCYMTAGSIMRFCDRNAVVWGTGIMHRGDSFAQPKHILAVRGPLTRARVLELGFACPEVYGDPALLLPRIYRPDVQRRHALGIVPHYYDFRDVRRRYKRCEGVHVINVLQPVEAVVRDVMACKRTIASSLHGVIVSHAYGVPTAWVRFSDRIPGDGVKYLDYFESVGLGHVTGPAPLHGPGPELDRVEGILGEASQPETIDVEALWDVCPFRTAPEGARRTK